jgi:UDP-N-acetyl-D-mannosaminuronate dehydrogenase
MTKSNDDRMTRKLALPFVIRHSISSLLETTSIAMIGTGYVGLVTGTCLAESGNEVTCVDIDLAKIERLRQEISQSRLGLSELVIRNAARAALHYGRF